YVLVRDGFELEEVYAAVDALDNLVSGADQLGFYAEIGRLIHVATGWFLRQGRRDIPLGARIDALLRARQALEPSLTRILPGFMGHLISERRNSFSRAGAPDALADRLAILGVSELVPDIAAVANSSVTGLVRSATAYFD